MAQKPKRSISELKFIEVVRKLNKKDFKLFNGLLKSKENLIFDLNRITEEINDFLFQKEDEQLSKLVKLKAKMRRDRKDKKPSE